jgi:hypothetical protein
MRTKLETVNAAIAIFAPGTTVRRGRTGWLVEWTDYRGKRAQSPLVGSSVATAFLARLPSQMAARWHLLQCPSPAHALASGSARVGDWHLAVLGWAKHQAGRT